MSAKMIRGDIEQMCPQCGKDWILPEAERLKLFEANTSAPKRCQECRRENKREGA
jgi:predicted RNA-binding Zn-ribbon protein involved in translation (DUF1610 family)